MATWPERMIIGKAGCSRHRDFANSRPAMPLSLDKPLPCLRRNPFGSHKRPAETRLGVEAALQGNPVGWSAGASSNSRLPVRCH